MSRPSLRFGRGSRTRAASRIADRATEASRGEQHLVHEAARNLNPLVSSFSATFGGAASLASHRPAAATTLRRQFERSPADHRRPDQAGRRSDSVGGGRRRPDAIDLQVQRSGARSRPLKAKCHSRPADTSGATGGGGNVRAISERPHRSPVVPATSRCLPSGSHSTIGPW